MKYRFGMWAASAALVASVAYGIPQLLQVAGVLVDPWDRILIFAPSLALAPAFVLTMVAVHGTAPAEQQTCSLAALAFAIMYGVMACIVYVTQLGVVIPHDLRGDGARYALLACCGQNQLMTGIDLIGYTLMSLSLLFAAPLFAGRHRILRLWLLANGALAPFLILQLAWPSLIYVGALWLVTFPMAMLLLARWFAGQDNAAVNA
ncbi:MAG TPA: hypothetical protein VIQ05_16340 [Tardiphaga sp.]